MELTSARISRKKNAGIAHKSTDNTVSNKPTITPELQAIIDEAREDFNNGKCVRFSSMDDFDRHYECV